MTRHITKIKTYWDESPNSRTIIYFAYKDVGICRIQINEGDNFATLYGLYVDEKYRNNGIGTLLIKSAEKELNNWNVKYMRIYVDKNALNADKLLNFYEHYLGYELFESSYSDEYGLLKKIKN
jgi:ribosomal protein S18 acetylase RimI-like enzyme